MVPAVTSASPASSPRRVFVVGATGYIGRHVVRELVGRRHEVVCLVRRGPGAAPDPLLGGAILRPGDVTDRVSIARDGLRGERYDAVISCLASRTGAPVDAWKIDHAANLAVLEMCREAGARHFVLLSAICVQKPQLEFQHAKLAFEDALVKSGVDYSIVRATAFFKSLAGQVENVKRGKPFVVFGDGSLTSCKPISEADLACFLADCLCTQARRNAVLPVGGPGPPITPRQQGELLFHLTGRPPRFRHVPVVVMDAIVAALTTAGRLVPSLREKAELAKIGRYYATESMLVWDAARGRYDAGATPEYGRDTLEAFYSRVLAEGLAGQELGDHAVFSRQRGP